MPSDDLRAENSPRERSSSVVSWLVRTIVWLVLGGWLGAWALFGLVIAPTAFQVLPSQSAAGALVGPILATLHNYGIAAGLVLSVLALLLRRGLTLASLPLCLALLCAISEYGVTPAIGEVAPRSFGAAQEPEASERFARLHQTSRLLYGCVGLGVLALVGLHVFAESDASSRRAGRGLASTPQPRP
jgi:hypothetical protein